jgi:hypothetical protein
MVNKAKKEAVDEENIAKKNTFCLELGKDKLKKLNSKTSQENGFTGPKIF